jgi:hypothetical protein
VSPAGQGKNKANSAHLELVLGLSLATTRQPRENNGLSPPPKNQRLREGVKNKK